MDLKGSKVLVTGGCGFVGSNLVDQLVTAEQVAEVRIIDNLTRGMLSNIEWAQQHGNVALIPKDIRNFDDIRPHFDGIDVVFHQAALRISACASHWRECQEVLVDGSFNVAEACVQAGVQKLIAASSASVYGMADRFPTAEAHTCSNNRTLYGAAKIANEALYRALHHMAGLDYVALRYFNVYGPRMDVFGVYTEVLIRWLERLDQGLPPQVHGDGSQTMDFVFVGDVVRANVLAARSPVTDEVLNIGSGQEVSLLELLEVLAQITGHGDLRPEFLPPAGINPVPRRLADSRKAWEVLGFATEVDLPEGLAELVRWRRELIDRQEQAECQPTDVCGTPSVH